MGGQRVQRIVMGTIDQIVDLVHRRIAFVKGNPDHRELCYVAIAAAICVDRHRHCGQHGAEAKRYVRSDCRFRHRILTYLV